MVKGKEDIPTGVLRKHQADDYGSKPTKTREQERIKLFNFYSLNTVCKISQLSKISSAQQTPG